MSSHHPLPVRYTRSRVPLQAAVHGVRAPVGPAGIYVSTSPHGFEYAAQEITRGSPNLTRTGLGPDSVAAEVATRTNRSNLFVVYAWAVGIGFLFTIFISELAIALLIAGLVGAYFVYRWDKTRRTARILYDIDDDEVVGRLALCNIVGETLATSQRLWQVASESAVYDRKYHAGASSLVGRVPTRVSNCAFPGVETNIGYWSVPIGPVQLLFLPDRLLVRRGARWWPLWYAELTAVDSTTRFIEASPVPSDTQVVDWTWRYTRKDGGPDLRFNNNHRIPVVLYGELTLTSHNGDHLTLQTSNPSSAAAAANAFRELARIAREPMVPAVGPPPNRVAAGVPPLLPGNPFLRVLPVDGQPTHKVVARVAAPLPGPTAPPPSPSANLLLAARVVATGAPVVDQSPPPLPPTASTRAPSSLPVVAAASQSLATPLASPARPSLTPSAPAVKPPIPESTRASVSPGMLAKSLPQSKPPTADPETTSLAPAPASPSESPAPSATLEPPREPHALNEPAHPVVTSAASPDVGNDLAPSQPAVPDAPRNPQAESQAAGATRASVNGSSPSSPSPVPMVRGSAAIRIPLEETEARFLDGTEALTIGGRTIRAPLTFMAARADSDFDASTIITSLPIGDGSRALPLAERPQYREAQPDQRARYLDWMAGGRVEPNIAIGYVFIFFYGLERRALRDRANINAVREEVSRLLAIYSGNNSFRRYASDFLAFTYLHSRQGLLAMSASDIDETLLPLMEHSEVAQAAGAAWYYSKKLPLPAEYAAVFVRDVQSARRGPVVTRSAGELLALFRIRYRGAFGDGVVLEAAKRPLTIEYRAASATLLGRGLTVSLPHVFKKVGQFSKILRVWNGCVDALRKAATKKGSARELDAAAWATLPDDLRAEYDHPDQNMWDTAIAAAPVLASFHITTIGVLAQLTGLDPGERLSPSQLKSVGQRAADVGYALEPEPRFRTHAVARSSEILAWRTEETKIPDPQVHGGISAMLSLAMTVAMADGVFAPEEDAVITSFLGEMFRLDEAMRARIEAMKQLIIRDPKRIGDVANTLRAQRSIQELTKIAGVLVTIAAADGVFAETEETALQRLYRELGLPAADFATAIARTGARRERSKPIEVPPIEARSGRVVMRPPRALRQLKLDQTAIDAIIADTKEVAAILAQVFESGDTDIPSQSERESPISSADATRPGPTALRRASEATAKIAHALDVRYHCALEDLLAKPTWSAAEVRELGTRHRLMPAAILDTINAWADETLGDFLIEEADGWSVHRELVDAST